MADSRRLQGSSPSGVGSVGHCGDRPPQRAIVGAAQGAPPAPASGALQSPPLPFPSMDAFSCLHAPSTFTFPILFDLWWMVQPKLPTELSKEAIWSSTLRNFGGKQLVKEKDSKGKNGSRFFFVRRERQRQREMDKLIRRTVGMDKWAFWGAHAYSRKNQQYCNGMVVRGGSGDVAVDSLLLGFISKDSKTYYATMTPLMSIAASRPAFQVVLVSKKLKVGGATQEQVKTARALAMKFLGGSGSHQLFNDVVRGINQKEDLAIKIAK